MPAAHGQGGHWSLDEVYDWSWREWLASLTEFQLDAILQGGTVLGIGVGPQNGLPDPLLGMGGPLWDFWVRVSPALAGGQDRIVYLHPGSDGGLRMCDASAEERIASCRRAGRGISAQLHALYPKMRPRLHPQPPQAQQGFEEARGGIARWSGQGCRRKRVVAVAARAFNGGGFLFAGFSGGASRCSSSSYRASVLTSASCRCGGGSCVGGRWGMRSGSA